MLSDSFAVFDPDYPEHPTVGWAVITWERIPAIYSTQQLSREVFLWMKLQLGRISVPKHWCFCWVLGLLLGSLILGLLLPFRVGKFELEKSLKSTEEEKFLC